MIKKLFAITTTATLLTSAAMSATTNVGVKASYGTLDATGSETTNDGATLTKSGNGDFPFGSIFVEREGNFSGFNVALGLDYIPFKAEVDKIGGGTGTDATVNLKDHVTVYIQPTKVLDNGLGIFAKLGYSEGKLNITDVTRQATAASTAAASPSSSDSGANKTLKGVMYGIGIEKTFSNSVFVRAEYNFTDYDEVSYTTSTSKVLKANSDLSTGSLTIGRKF
jgi:opacity protein-like surface antigen